MQRQKRHQIMTDISLYFEMFGINPPVSSADSVPANLNSEKSMHRHPITKPLSSNTLIVLKNIFHPVARQNRNSDSLRTCACAQFRNVYSNW